MRLGHVAHRAPRARADRISGHLDPAVCLQRLRAVYGDAIKRNNDATKSAHGVLSEYRTNGSDAPVNPRLKHCTSRVEAPIRQQQTLINCGFIEVLRNGD